MNLQDDENKINFLEAIYKLYANTPKDSSSIQLIPIPENNEDIDFNKKNDIYLFVFEMLLEFYLEGIMHYKDLANILNAKITHNYENINFDEIESKFIDSIYDDYIVNDINSEILKINQEWLNSIGYFLHVNEYNDEYFDQNDQQNEYYCKIILKNNPDDYGYFYIRKIEIPYHIIINGNYDNNKIQKISDIKCKLSVNKKVYLISFEEISNILTNTNNHACRY